MKQPHIDETAERARRYTWKGPLPPESGGPLHDSEPADWLKWQVELQKGDVRRDVESEDRVLGDVPLI